MKIVWLAAIHVLVFCAGCEGMSLAQSIEGYVYIERDGNGVFSSGDTVVPGAVVVWETSVFATTDESGFYSMDLPMPGGIVWVRSTDEFEPSPVWAEVGSSASVDLGLTLDENPHPFSFVAASDSHAGIEFFAPGDQFAALAQTADIFPTPHFVTVTGDITQSNMPEQFEEIIAAIEQIPIPYVPVPGNHDWYDGGAAYRRFFGPPNYSFDAGGLHFLVLNDADSVALRSDFITRDLALVDDGRPLVALMHAPPEDALIQVLEGAGVEFLFTGHQHANRVLFHDSMVEYNTQPLTMGGIDHTPAGFRVITPRLDRTLDVEHRTIVDEPIVSAIYPRTGESIPDCNVSILAAVASGADVSRVYALVDGRELELEAAGGWVYQGSLADVCPDGPEFVLGVHAESATQSLSSRQQQVSFAQAPASSVAIGDWPMVQGNAGHHGAIADEIAPPLRRIWATPVGGHIQGGSPVTWNERVYVSLVDYADARSGGVVCLDGHTGAVLWRFDTGFAVRNAPAVDSGVVVVAANDGTIMALDAVTGALLWDYALAQHVAPVLHNIYGAPTIADGVVYVGVQRELVALDLLTGTPLWSTEPYDYGGMGSSYASPAVASGMVVDSFGRGLDGLMAWDVATGQEIWATPRDISFHLNGSPLIDDDTVYAINESVQVHALDVFTGQVRWVQSVSDQGFPWAFGVMATPALANGRLFIPTQFGVLHAVDAATGVELWRHESMHPSLVRPVHYKASIPAFSAEAVVTGDIVWVGEAGGQLLALSAATGESLWTSELCVPILAGPAAAGEYLIVATYDGVVHAYAPASEDVTPLRCDVDVTLADMEPTAQAGCCSSGERRPGSSGLLALLVALCTLRPRTRRHASRR